MVKVNRVIIVADDDPDDQLLVTEALKETGFTGDIHYAQDGQELVDYLHGGSPLPSIILLDLNMPRKDGREALKEIKSHPDLRCIPIVIFSTSDAKEDIEYSYGFKVNSYIVKPSSFDELKKALSAFVDYWFKVAHLPC